MSLYQKYRVREFGKDFNMKPQDVMGLLEARFGEAPANQQAVLSADQLNYLFDYLIEKNQIATLATYFQAYQGKESYADRKRRLKQEAEAKKEEAARKAKEAAEAEQRRKEEAAARKQEIWSKLEKDAVVKGIVRDNPELLEEITAKVTEKLAEKKD